MRVTIIGAGKVGTSLASALRERGQEVVLRRRRTRSQRPVETPLLVIATRDGEVRTLAEELAQGRRVSARTAVVHTAGALGPEVLAPLRSFAAGIGQAHPLLSFAASRVEPPWSRALLLVQGDRAAVRGARELARVLGMTARAWKIDPVLYHAA